MSLDGHDVLETMATGAGKMGFFTGTFLMLVIRAIFKDSTIGTRSLNFIPRLRRPCNDSIVLCSTKAFQLEADMGCTISELLLF